MPHLVTTESLTSKLSRHSLGQPRAVQPLPTALLWREQTGTDLVTATHDGLLATAARASGLWVVGM